MALLFKGSKPQAYGQGCLLAQAAEVDLAPPGLVVALGAPDKTALPAEPLVSGRLSLARARSRSLRGEEEPRQHKLRERGVQGCVMGCVHTWEYQKAAWPLLHGSPVVLEQR